MHTLLPRRAEGAVSCIEHCPKAPGWPEIQGQERIPLLKDAAAGLWEHGLGHQGNQNHHLWFVGKHSCI